MEDIKILEWITNNSGDSDSNGYGCGLGSGPGADINSSYGDSSGYGSDFGFGYIDGSGCGSGFEYDSGYSDGSGYGSGDGSGDGSDCGYGLCRINRYSSGFGYVCGYSIKSFNSKIVYLIDNVETIISDIKGNLAKGFILNIDFSLSPCYICKSNGYFAHGETLKEAKQSLRKKILENMNTDETIEQFLSTFEKEKKYFAKDFYEWHHYLTGSCEMGRKSFMQDRNITFGDMYTVDEFITLCEDSYGGEIIKELKERWNYRNG